MALNLNADWNIIGRLQKLEGWANVREPDIAKAISDLTDTITKQKAMIGDLQKQSSALQDVFNTANTAYQTAVAGYNKAVDAWNTSITNLQNSFKEIQTECGNLSTHVRWLSENITTFSNTMSSPKISNLVAASEVITVEVLPRLGGPTFYIPKTPGQFFVRAKEVFDYMVAMFKTFKQDSDNIKTDTTNLYTKFLNFYNQIKNAQTLSRI